MSDHDPHSEKETETDSALLRKFHVSGDEGAFTALVTRWLPMLEHCARRITGDAELSRDAVQRVFCQLARKAGPLAAAGRSPAPWLHRAVTLECRSLLRRERTRLRALRRCAEEQATVTGMDMGMAIGGGMGTEASHGLWQQALPHLDAAIDSLPAPERRLIMARYFEKRSWREIGADMGRTPDAARMALNPALEKLALSLRSRRVPADAALLAVSLAGLAGESSSHAATPGRTESIVRAALPCRATGGWSLPFPPWAAAVAGFLVAAPTAWMAARPAALTSPAPGSAAWSPVTAASTLTSTESEGKAAAFDLPALLAGLRRLQPSGNNPMELARLRALLIDLPAGALPEVFGVLKTKSWHRDTRSAAEAFFARWAEIDPAAAFAAAKTDEMTGAWISTLTAILNTPGLPPRLSVQCMARLRDRVSHEDWKSFRGRLAEQDWRGLAGTWERTDEARCFMAAVLSFADLSEPGSVELLRPAALADRRLLPVFAARWAATDEPAALTWLETLPAGTMEHDIPALAMARILSEKDPARAVELIRDLPLSERYELDIAAIWRAWRNHDRGAAEAALAQRNLSPKALENLKRNMR